MKVAGALTAAIMLASCTGGSMQNGASMPQQFSPLGSSGSGYIAHVVVVIQENRSFDDFFSTFPGAEGTIGGCMEAGSLHSMPRAKIRPASSHGCPSGDSWVRLAKVDLREPCDFGHSYHIVPVDYDHGKMDGFGFEGGSKNCPGKVGTKVYQFVDPAQIKPYWRIAHDYVLADQMFQTQGSGSFTAHQDLIAASTIINQPQDTESIVDYPTGHPWGCDAPAGTRTSLVVYKHHKVNDDYGKGPFPCFTYATMRDLLDAKGISWKYYSPREPHGTGAYWNGFNAIKAVREGSEWNSNIKDTNDFFHDVAGSTLPAVSWIVPDEVNSDHPGSHSATGPSWVASIVNTIGESPYWDSTAIVILWDDWGGFYDNAPPPFFDHWGGLGFRVPMMVVSAYARQAYPTKAGYISHTQYEFGSILKFIENVFVLGSLGTTDARATSIIDCFDFSQKARRFIKIPADYSREYFLSKPPSYLPVDTE
ncbi:MAG: alkaline phosphatase family protein [Candidatus Cybelea sp.]